jgi:hypothetical protein
MNALATAVLSIRCPRCFAAIGEACDREIAPYSPYFPCHPERFYNRPLARNQCDVNRDYVRSLPEETKKERKRKSNEAAKKKRREQNWRRA